MLLLIRSPISLRLLGLHILKVSSVCRDPILLEKRLKSSALDFLETELGCSFTRKLKPLCHLVSQELRKGYMHPPTPLHVHTGHFSMKAVTQKCSWPFGPLHRQRDLCPHF